MDPKDLRFTKSHEWISSDGTVGISDHAQHEITDVVFVELPKMGRTVKAEEACAVVESVKAAFDIYAPVPGTIVAINEEGAKIPDSSTNPPTGRVGFIKSKMTSPADREKLMTHDQYQSFIKSGAH